MTVFNFINEQKLLSTYSLSRVKKNESHKGPKSMITGAICIILFCASSGHGSRPLRHSFQRVLKKYNFQNMLTNIFNIFYNMFVKYV